MIASRLTVGKPSPAPRPAPWATRPRIRCGRPRNRCVLDSSFGQASTDERRRDEFSIDTRRLDDLECDPRLIAPFAEYRDVSQPIVSEGEIRPFDHAVRGELADDNTIEEFPGREFEEPGAGPEHADLGGTRLAEQGDLPIRPDQRDRGLVRPQQSNGMWIERYGEGRGPRGVGPGPEPADQVLVTTMDPVEVAYRDVGASGPGGELADVLDRDQCFALLCSTPCGITESFARPADRA